MEILYENKWPYGKYWPNIDIRLINEDKITKEDDSNTSCSNDDEDMPDLIDREGNKVTDFFDDVSSCDDDNEYERRLEERFIMDLYDNDSDSLSTVSCDFNEFDDLNDFHKTIERMKPDNEKNDVDQILEVGSIDSSGSYLDGLFDELAMMNVREWNAQEMQMKIKRNLWIGDSGASTHMTNNDVGMFDCEPTNEPITVGNGQTLVATKIGKLRVRVTQTNGNQMIFDTNKREIRSRLME